MALEQFKTQVLLLHSQQSTLDALGAGFNDRYSVHFATSGSEALTTLGETPIHIIVSAQELPGMSGLEALREAKKRSPDTIGILLAGDESDGSLEALVGEQEVFQIVRGAVQPDALLKIVETAARRMRMLTLAQSANDTAANVDVPVDSSDSGEHIIMETAENGSNIISDGTGRLPALKPEKIGAGVDVSGRAVDVLVLTKDSEFLETIRESARGLHQVHHAVTAQQAQDTARNHPVGVLVTDAAIAGSKVELLTQKLRGVAPRLVAIVAGRRDDGDMLMELINRGQVYRFLLKPVSPGRARLAVEASVKHHLDAADSMFGKVAAAPPPVAAPKPAPAPQKPAAAAPPPKKKAEPVVRKTPELAPPAAAEANGEVSLSESGSLRATTRNMAAQVAAKKSGRDRDGKPALPLAAIAAAAAVVLLAGGIAWYAMSGAPDEVPAVVDSASPGDTAADNRVDDDAVETPQEAAPPAAVAAPEPAYVALLDNARFARDSGRILSPSGDNAIEWYVAAREAAPANTVIAEELAALVDQVIGMAETALLEERMDDADAALQMVAVASPGNSRLNFLNAQLDQMMLRSLLDDARAAIRESRFEDAAQLLGNAQSFPGINVAQVDQVAEELASARSAQRVEDVIGQANERLAAGSLTEPSNDNARYFFELALSNDAQNAAARQGLLIVASKLVLQARTAIDNGEFELAAASLEDARALDPQSADLQATEAALQAGLDRQAEAERMAAVARLAASRDAAAQRAAEARRRAADSATLSTSDDSADASGAAVPAGDATLDENTQASNAAGAGIYLPASAGDDLQPVLTNAVRRTAGNERPTAPAAAPELAPDQPIAVSQLTRANYVAPKYPRLAQRRGTSGWVDVAFTVTPAGSVSEVRVTDSDPGSVFDDAATDAVSQWRFEPVIENGRPVFKKVAVRMSFNLK